jgi:hypothetical protein
METTARPPLRPALFPRQHPSFRQPCWVEGDRLSGSDSSPAACQRELSTRTRSLKGSIVTITFEEQDTLRSWSGLGENGIAGPLEHTAVHSAFSRWPQAASLSEPVTFPLVARDT